VCCAGAGAGACAGDLAPGPKKLGWAAVLEVSAHPHREFLQAHTAQQKLYVALRLRPSGEALGARPALSIAFVVDTSGSMREKVTKPATRAARDAAADAVARGSSRDARSKLQLVMEALHGLMQERDALAEGDRIALVQFDDDASVVAPFTQAGQARTFAGSIDRLTEFSGGTHLGAGMRLGVRLLSDERGSRRMVLLSDGNTFDEGVVHQVSEDLLRQRIPVTVIGVGADVNLDLLTKVADRTQGRMMDVVPDVDDPQPPSVRASDLPQEILADVRKASTEVVTDIGLSIKVVKDVTIDRITRVYPALSEVDTSVRPFPLGNAAGGDETVFVIEATLPGRPPARMRLAQIGVTYSVPGRGYRGEEPPIDVVIEFTHDDALAARVDSMVMDYVKQRNIESLIDQASREARTDPERARKTIELARSMTQKLGNTVMTQALDRAMGELGSSKTISLGTVKTLRIGAKTQTMKMTGGPAAGLPSEEEIRRLTQSDASGTGDDT
jgi:Ca-activated chloride channel homolog